jgi:hypothetical protein
MHRVPLSNIVKYFRLELSLIPPQINGASILILIFHQYITHLSKNKIEIRGSLYILRRNENRNKIMLQQVGYEIFFIFPLFAYCWLCPTPAKEKEKEKRQCLEW